MPTKSHHRSRSSVDHVLELLAVLPEDDIAHLLDDFNHTTSSNVPVSEAIALFDPAKPKPKRFRASSPVRRLEAELVRRNSKRISSAPEPFARPKSATQPPAPTPKPLPSAPVTTLVTQADTESYPELQPEPEPQDRVSRPSLTLSPPDSFDRPQTADASLESRVWSYKRISRPLILSPTAKAELHELLLAYLAETPDSATSTATSSPITPSAASLFSPFGPIRTDRDVPGIDLLEPSPTRMSQYTFGRGGKSPAESMSGIFEILTSH
ncbi:hypothetical protein QBC34DRAFT_412575 [Podospora aff. communis PSN243]|uniref:CUE domain-containing protein n=1 Tax=Podospora aff. communis PSN243 TaxID=3040156 RepID=A0AAV9GC26_9PEZI|nr:hypothetical protein QBC34DRAFT_412575 [Podospora aff. communis PSN243]